MKLVVLLLCLTVSAPTMASDRRHLIIDHDAGVDDLASIAIAYYSNQFVIDGITICPADSFKRPAIQITTALVKFLGMNHVQIAASDNEGKNLFPEKWRSDSLRMAQINELVLAETEYPKFGYSPMPAAKKLVELLSGKIRYEILATGPLSNIADALKLNPTISNNIKKIYFMGGAVHVHGNVEESKHDLSAEWNVYNNPEAFSLVLRAGIPVVLVALDATNKVPVTKEFMRALKHQDTFRVSHLFHQVWSVIATQIESPNYQQTYFFWDTLASAIAANPNIAATKNEKIKVVLDGKSEGRTLADPDGYSIELLADPSPQKLHKFILDAFRI